MLLAIDVGNTNLVFALFDGEDLRARWRISTDGRRTGDEYAVWLFQLLGIEGVAREDITHIIFGSVVPRADHNLTVLCEKYFGITPIVAGHGEAGWGFEIDVDLPSTLGADRALNCIAAHEMIGGDMIVVDFGTATKFEVVDYNGAYKGGIIAPGINLSMQALHAAAAKLPRVASAKPQRVMGKDTVSAMQSGVFWGYIDLIDGLVNRIKEEYGKPMSVVATGGVASLFEGASETIDHYDQDLLIRGLLEIYRLNK